MKKEIKNFINYVKTLNYEGLVQEGALCASNLFGSVLDFKTGEIKSQDDFAQKMTALTLVLFQAAGLDGLASFQEFEFISKTTGTSVEVLKEWFMEFKPENLQESFGTGYYIMSEITESFKTKEEMLYLAKFVVLLCAVDEKISFSEKTLINQLSKFFD